MDPLRRDDLERARTATPEQKLIQAVELMAVGIELRRAGLRARRPHASEIEIEEELRRWLESK